MRSVATDPVVIVAALLALSLHVVVDLPVFGGHPLRIGLADLFLPLLLALLVLRWKQGGGDLPTWRPQSLWFAIAVFTGALSLALGIGAWRLGHVSTWSLVNKYLGWFVLLGYLIAGGLMRAVLAPEARVLVVRTLLAAAAAACLWSIGLRVLVNLELVAMVNHQRATPLQEILGLVWSRYRMSGFLVNSNTFGFVCGALILLQLPLCKHRLVFTPIIHRLVLTLLLVCVPYSGGRAAFVAFIAGLVALAFIHKLAWRQLATASLSAVALAALMHTVPTLAAAARGETAELGLASVAPNVTTTSSVQERAAGYDRALELWREAPLTGIGLGGFLADQVDAGAQVPQVIHSTWLWLLAETGPVGLATFSLLALVIARALWQMRADPIAAGTLAMLVAAGVMSFAHEMLYQRLIWLLLGLALVKGSPLQEPPAESNR